MKASKPILHGRDHVTGGADPVPGLLPAQTAGNFPAQILALPDLRGYWRLGEGVSPYADTSGNALGPHDMLRNVGTVGGSSVPMTEDVTPGLLPAATDDGAVGFNQDEPEPSPLREFLENPTGAGAAQFNFSGTATMSAVAVIQPGSATHTFWGGVVGDMNAVAPLNGWGLRVRYPTLEIDFLRAQDATHYHSATAAPVTAGDTVMVVGTYDGALIRLYVNGVLAASVADTSSLGYSGSNSVQIGGFWWDIGTYSTWQPFFGVVDEVAVYGSVLSDTDVAGLFAATSAVGEGWVPVSDGNGGVVWQPPTDVTVNGRDNTSTVETPVPAAPVAPVDPSSAFPGTDDWVVDEAFCWNGGTFTVPPHKWTTIPFTDPLMGRWSNITPHGTWLTELDWDDPAAAGWIDPATPRAITVPHDMPFMDLISDPYVWMQICLRIESPLVEAETSYRGLRVFETTHQKALVEANGLRAVCCQSHGAVDVFRDQDVPGWTGDSTIFASGDTGGLDNGNHDRVFFMPNFELAYYLHGLYWLPVVAGTRTLKKGMRLVPQVWHDASVPLTFTCAPAAGTLYRPHFVVWQTMDRGWGPPWSDWPLYP
jgi:Concanavalin A-like lectin/glucanases superfamily